MTVIGLVGTAGSGKTTVADYLMRAHGGVFHALSRPIKQILGDMYDLSDVQLYGTQDEKEAVDPRYGVSPRDLMHRMGDALQGAFGVSCLVERVIQKIRLGQPRLAIVEDVRRLHEAEALRNCLDDVYLLRLPEPEVSRGHTHPAENEWRKIKCDREIPRTDSLEILYREIDHALVSLDIWSVIHSIEH